MSAPEYDTIFPVGEKAEGSLRNVFSGDVMVNKLVNDQKLNCPVYNVTFSPGCRNNWHIHYGGQILMCTGGSGWYQEEGKPAVSLVKGTIVEIPANVKHWHGAKKDSWCTHIAIEANPQFGPCKWLEAVSDEDYNKL